MWFSWSNAWNITRFNSITLCFIYSHHLRQHSSVGKQRKERPLPFPALKDFSTFWALEVLSESMPDAWMKAEGGLTPSSAPDISHMRAGSNPADWYSRRHSHVFRRADTVPTLPGTIDFLHHHYSACWNKSFLQFWNQFCRQSQGVLKAMSWRIAAVLPTKGWFKCRNKKSMLPALWFQPGFLNRAANTIPHLARMLVCKSERQHESIEYFCDWYDATLWGMVFSWELKVPFLPTIHVWNVRMPCNCMCMCACLVYERNIFKPEGIKFIVLCREWESHTPPSASHGAHTIAEKGFHVRPSTRVLVTVMSSMRCSHKCLWFQNLKQVNEWLLLHVVLLRCQHRHGMPWGALLDAHQANLYPGMRC